ncbi:MAG TPA: hypothetical protein VL625_08540, partial [Patescibacteria group bacterium]|nr:hypothetical protein [Patescibacteria group bacterium]
NEALDVLNRYPDILTFDDEPPSAFERGRSRYVRGDNIMRVYIMTRRLGDMLLKLDDSMTLAEKNALWGRYEDYDHARYSRSDEPNPNLGRPREVEEYVRRKLAGLKDEISAELDVNERKVLQFPAPAHKL